MRTKTGSSISFAIFSGALVVAGAILIAPSYMEWYIPFFNNHWGWEQLGFRWIPLFRGLGVNALIVAIGILPGVLFFRYKNQQQPRTTILAGLWFLGIPGGSAAIVAMPVLALTALLGLALD